MRNTWDSSKTAWTVWFRARAEARSVPNGFSMITREFCARPESPSRPTTDPKAAGGTARGRMARGARACSRSARSRLHAHHLVALLCVAAELASHRGQDLVGERAQPARLEPLDQRGGDHG